MLSIIIIPSIILLVTMVYTILLPIINTLLEKDKVARVPSGARPTTSPSSPSLSLFDIDSNSTTESTVALV